MTRAFPLIGEGGITPGMVIPRVLGTTDRFATDKVVPIIPDWARLDALAEAQAPAIDFLAERAKAMLDSLHGWLEPQIRAAFDNGMDFAMTEIVGPGDRPQLRPDTLSWVETRRWQGAAIEAGTNMPATWTVYRRPSNWPELADV